MTFDLYIGRGLLNVSQFWDVSKDNLEPHFYSRSSKSDYKYRLGRAVQVKSSQELLSGIHEQGAAKKHGACPRSGRCVLVRAMSQQLNGCVGWVYVRGRCAFSDFSLSLSKFIAFGACLTLYLPRAARAGVQ